MNITICGGGNLGHVCSGFIGANPKHRVSLLTTQPERWANEVHVSDLNGKVYQGRIQTISSSAEKVIPEADMVLVCLPGFAIHQVLKQIAPYLQKETWVGTVVSSTGFFFEAMQLLPQKQPLFGFQRVPFIARTNEYGHSAELRGYKDSLSVAIEQTENKETVRKTLEDLFCTPTKLLKSYYEVALSNSNPLLHTARLYTLWHDWEPGKLYEDNPFFYADWTVEASALLIKMDVEFQSLLQQIGVRNGSIPPVLVYYESHDAESLTRKLRSIPAFQGILSPMKSVQGGWVPDFANRYFTEDFLYGMRYICEFSQKKNFSCPHINEVYKWGEGCLFAYQKGHR